MRSTLRPVAGERPCHLRRQDSETRNPKSETNLNTKIQNPKRRQPAFWSFGFRGLDLFRISCFGFRILGRHVYQLRLHGDARAHLLQAVDDHPLARLHAVRGLPQAVVERSQPYGAGDHLVLLVHDVDDLLPLVGIDGAVRDKQGLMGKANRHTGASASSLLGNTPRNRRVPVLGLI